LNGKALRNCHIRVKRGEQIVYSGILDSLKRMKEDVKEVNAGFECGIRLDRFSDWKEGDIIETFQMVSKRRTLTV
jgi:translation initiation factor IF-2